MQIDIASSMCNQAHETIWLFKSICFFIIHFYNF